MYVYLRTTPGPSGGMETFARVHCSLQLSYIWKTELYYTVKKFIDFPVPSRKVTYQAVPGGE